MSLFAEGEPRRNHKTFAVYRSRRRFRRSLRSPAEWWFARYAMRGNKGGIGQSPATAGAPRRPCFPFHPLHGAPFRRRR